MKYFCCVLVLGLQVPVTISSGQAAPVPGSTIATPSAVIVNSLPKDRCIALESEEEHCASVQPVWINDGSVEEGPFSFDRLAHITAPILWLSPREFLLLEDKKLFSPGLVESTAEGRTVYYRIREVQLKKPTAGSNILSVHDDRIRNSRLTWSQAKADLPLYQLDKVFITFFFYYPEDRGVGHHPHDLEALEVQVRFQRACERHTDKTGVITKIQRSDSDNCWLAAWLESASGSAHGVGWYTNTLQVSSTRDTVLPLFALVEENKHATSPDRDGDGKYVPHYDVNRQSNDAWGVRDLTGSGRLGGSVYNRDRKPDTQVCPPDPSKRLILFSTQSQLSASPFNEVTGCAKRKETHALVVSRGDPVCKQLDMLKDGDANKKLRGLLLDKQFCAEEKLTTVKGPKSLVGGSLLKVARFVSPGPDSEYGFQNAVQRLSVSYRYDGGQGVSIVAPVGHEVPIFGGWAVVKVNAIAENLSGVLPPLQKTSIEAMYSPSASRAIDWYVTAGRESFRAKENDERIWSTAEEIGVKFRFSQESARIIKFWGIRLGLRAESFSHPHNVRFVFEFGSGSF